MKKVSHYIVAACIVFMVLLAICIYQENSYEWLFAFLSLVSLLSLCVIENKNTQKLKIFAYKDGLTGVQNRTAYEEKVDTINEEIRKNKKVNFGIVVFDVNGLKRINDSFGHRAGDLCISHAAKLIKSVYANADVFRIGGDEFVAITRDKQISHTEAWSKSFAEKIDNFNNKRNNLPFNLSVALGSAVYDKETDSNFSDTFNRADKLMYDNKNSIKQKGD